MTGLSVRDVHDLIVDRLATGEYPLGTRLPPSRDLAVELGINRNTAAKAYGMLADQGLLTVQQGRGTFVAALPGDQDRPTLAAQIRWQLTRIVRRARTIGVAPTELSKLVDDVITETYGTRRRRAIFVECNQNDVDGGVQEIEALVGLRLDPCLLSRLAADPVGVTRDYDVVCTSLFHLNEVTDLVRARGRAELQVIGVYTQPDEEALNAIARLPSGSRVAVAAADEAGARRFASLISTISTAEADLLVQATPEQIRAATRRVSTIITSRSQFARVQAAGIGLPTIVLAYHVSPQSARRILDSLCPPVMESAAERPTLAGGQVRPMVK